MHLLITNKATQENIEKTKVIIPLLFALIPRSTTQMSKPALTGWCTCVSSLIQTYAGTYTHIKNILWIILFLPEWNCTIYICFHFLWTTSFLHIKGETLFFPNFLYWCINIYFILYVDSHIPHSVFLFCVQFCFHVLPLPSHASDLFVHKAVTPSLCRFVYNWVLIISQICSSSDNRFQLLFVVTCSSHFCKMTYLHSNHKA